MTNEELEQEVKRLEEQITNLRIKFLESEANKKSYEVKMPEDIEMYYTTDVKGELKKVGHCRDDIHEYIYKYGNAFENSYDAILNYKERILLFKLHNWAEEHNEGWIPDWEECDDKFYINYHYGLDWFKVSSNMRVNAFNKLPYFKSEELAMEFIEEFGKEIKEVLC